MRGQGRDRAGRPRQVAGWGQQETQSYLFWPAFQTHWPQAAGA